MISAVQRGLEVLAATQSEEGSWKGDYGGPLFLLPVYVAGLSVMGRAPEPHVARGFIEHLTRHQNADGGWGLDVESHSHVFTSVLNYVAMRLLGVRAGDARLLRARAWFLARGGPLASGSWGKFILALLGLYAYEGLHPVQPELWLVPESFPAHPSKLWCHCRMVYLPMSWLYGRRVCAAETPLLVALRHELYEERYEGIDWADARDRVAASDAYTPRSALLHAVNPLLGLFERLHPRRLRERALDHVLEHIRAEDAATNGLCIGPINKVLNMVVWHVSRPGGPEVQAHLEALPAYLFSAADGIKVNGYNSSELWDTAFALQASVAAQEVGGVPTPSMMAQAAAFLDRNQVRADTPEARRFYRHPSRGGWPFSTLAHGWPISDCTAEAIKASLLLEPLGLNGVSRARLAEAVGFLLSLQNPDGGWATYELQRGGRWLEQLNPSDVFATIMVDVSYVECTSACVQALAAWRAQGETSPPVDRAIERGARFLRGAQRADGSWEGSWGVCFSYGTWFGVVGLLAAGAKPEDSCIQRAAAFLKTRQRPDGSWSETAESCRRRQWVDGSAGHSVQTSWALLTLVAAGEGASVPVARGARWLKGRQRPDGSWPAEPLAGVFNRTCAIHYDAYLKVFPLWALSACAKADPGRALPEP